MQGIGRARWKRGVRRANPGGVNHQAAAPIPATPPAKKGDRFVVGVEDHEQGITPEAIACLIDLVHHIACEPNTEAAHEVLVP